MLAPREGITVHCRSKQLAPATKAETVWRYLAIPVLLSLCLVSARLWNWRLDVYLLLALLVCVLPFYHCYLLLLANGN